ncbi:MAG TPA: LamG-like jellyroll fold domain-containing protein, partial [Bdellovibrionales bacterium]|nr:LamG-like jellyroll fold domain-containing protein [Bdellovibrionales bacterium]
RYDSTPNADWNVASVTYSTTEGSATGPELASNKINDIRVAEQTSESQAGTGHTVIVGTTNGVSIVQENFATATNATARHYTFEGTATNAGAGNPNIAPFNNVVALDGTSGCVNLGNASALSYSTGIEFWFRPNTTWNSSGSVKYLWNKGADAASGMAYIRYNAGAGGTLQFAYNNGTATYIATSGAMTFTAGQWYHIAATITPSGGNKSAGRLLVNGSSVATSAQTAEAMNAWAGAAASAYLGCYEGASGFVDAAFDEYRFGVQSGSDRYTTANYTVPTSEVLADTKYNQRVSFNGNVGDTAVFTTYGINATLIGGAALAARALKGTGDNVSGVAVSAPTSAAANAIVVTSGAAGAITELTSVHTSTATATSIATGLNCTDVTAYQQDTATDFDFLTTITGTGLRLHRR